MITAITNARLFDGERVLEDRTVIIEGGRIAVVGATVPRGAALVDAAGGYVLPGLIDSHVHTSLDGLRDALAFGVTTQLDMMGPWPADVRHEVTHRDDIADLRCAGYGVTAPGGHPSELFVDVEPPPGLDVDRGVATPGEAAEFVASLVAEGSDYIKIMIEEGTVLGAPGLPVLTDDIITAAVRAAHGYHRLAVAHALTVDATRRAVGAGVDGLTHAFIDGPHSADVVASIAASGVFVTPCLALTGSLMGHGAHALTADRRVRARLNSASLDTLNSSINTYAQGRFDDVLATVAALHESGVDILAGSDASGSLLPGLAHGASLHHELQLLVAAGLSPIEALRAATSVPARRFGLLDCGRIATGARADLLLVDGDPTVRIDDTLSIVAVWRRGVRLGRAVE